ncbi:MAG TPA: hypothetical protein VMV81_07270 [Phycisphaerae bacterium]|nr:hypothetical protein [Phycisphaerae bacterium]
MNRFARKNCAMVALAMAMAPWLLGASCGGTAVVVAPDASKALDGTYLITSTVDDLSQLPPNPTLVISGGLLTELGTTAVTPQSATASGDHYVWSSAATVNASGLPAPLATTVTLDTTLQADKTLTGTLVLSALSQSVTFHVTLTKQ